MTLQVIVKELFGSDMVVNDEACWYVLAAVCFLLGSWNEAYVVTLPNDHKREFRCVGHFGYFLVDVAQFSCFFRPLKAQ